jgi:predicted amidohydrolase
MEELRLIEKTGVEDSPARTRPPGRAPLRIAAVQQRWHPDPDEHREALAAGIRMAAAQGARLVCLQELTLSPYFAVDPGGPAGVGVEPEELPGGPTCEFAAAMARENHVHVHASLYERAPDGGLGYSLAGAEVLIYPTAIGSEPDHPDFDTQPLWERVIVANGIANGTFMVAVNRFGEEPPLRFYGSSFISDPYGRVLVQAPRDAAAVLVADLDLDQRGDWLELFPFLTTRRPEAYATLVERLAEPVEGGAEAPR